MKDVTQPALDIGKREARKLINRQVALGRLAAEAGAGIDSAIVPTLDYLGLKSVDAVIEAVVENINIKKVVLAEVESRVRSETILASNTSSLSITQMATVLRRPDNFAGMHFFNPVHSMSLVEVIRGERTSDVAAATVVAYAAAMGKTPVVVKDCPGFLVNRILTPYVIGFLQLVRDGADFEQVDQVMENFGWPMGPAYLQDVIGMDTASHVYDIIAGGYPERMRIDFRDVIHVLAEQGRFGQKKGAGFYRYEAKANGRPVKLTAPEAHALIFDLQSCDRRKFEPVEITQRMMLPMIIEAAVCVMDKVAETAAEIDMNLILGLGFPRYLGGPRKYADRLGLRTVVAQCDSYSLLKRAGPVGQYLREMAETGARFHG